MNQLILGAGSLAEQTLLFFLAELTSIGQFLRYERGVRPFLAPQCVREALAHLLQIPFELLLTPLCLSQQLRQSLLALLRRGQ